MLKLLNLAFPALVGWMVYQKKKSITDALLGALGAWVVMRILPRARREGFGPEWEKVHLKGTGHYPIDRSPTQQAYYAGHPYNAPHAAHPFIDPPYLLRNKGAEAETEGFGGDLTLTNMYRRLHNLDAIQRTEVFQFNDALAGGSYGIPREPWVGEAYDRGMMDLKQQIREDIAKKRRPFDEAYDIPTKPLMGNFWECHMGDCQWDADSEGHILGIPSQVGTRHAYF
jgi:hypothetical protein